MYPELEEFASASGRGGFHRLCVLYLRSWRHERALSVHCGSTTIGSRGTAASKSRLSWVRPACTHRHAGPAGPGLVAESVGAE